MDKLQTILFLFVLCFYLYTSIKQSMHMYQQNRYQMKRYRSWLYETVHIKRKEIMKLFGCFMGIYGLLFIPKSDVFVVEVLLLLIYSYVLYKMEDMKTYRKPLVFTSRVQRLLCAFYVVYSIFFFIISSFISIRTWLYLLPFFYFTPWFVVIFIGLGMQPIEEWIRQYYAKQARRILDNQKRLCCIAITGSYGKTSVKTILHELFADTYYTLMTPRSYNNLMGITLTIRQQLQSLHEIFLCEMGADHVHEIERLMDFVKPSIGIVTAVGPQHLQTFHTIGNILHEKMQMIEKLPSSGVGFINLDNAYIRGYHIRNTCKIITFGIHQISDYQASDIVYRKEGTSFVVHHAQQSYAFTTKLLGEHNVLNITCAIAVAHHQGIEWEILKRLVANLPYVEHRLQIRESNTYTILDNAYNSNPEGAGYALDVIKQMEGKHIIVTPGFLDLGDTAIKAHIVFGEQIANSVDIAILVGKQQTSDIVKGLRNKNFPLSKLFIVNSIEEAFALLDQFADANTTVLLENDLPDAFNH